MKLAILYAGQGSQHPGMGKTFTKHIPLSGPLLMPPRWILTCTASALKTRTAF